MRSRQSIPLLLALLILVSLACSIGTQAQAPTPSNPLDLASTIVAMTLQVQGLPTSAGPVVNTPFASPIPATPTPGKALLYINTDNAKCRTGEGQNFKVVASFATGTTLEMVGKDTTKGYWEVRVPGSAEACWVQIQDGTPSGSYESLPEVTPQAGAQNPPGRPGRRNWNFSCDNTSLTTILSWSATTNDVNGYRVYRLGSQIADLAATTTTYTETIAFRYGSHMTYAVEAYNDAGTSSQLIWDFNCPP